MAELDVCLGRDQQAWKRDSDDDVDEDHIDGHGKAHEKSKKEKAKKGESAPKHSERRKNVIQREFTGKAIRHIQRARE